MLKERSENEHMVNYLVPFGSNLNITVYKINIKLKYV